MLRSVLLRRCLNLCTGAFENLIATITNGSNSVDVQWERYDVPTTSWVDIAGATNLNYLVPTAVIGSTQYRARITDPGSGCSTPYSTISTVNIFAGASAIVTVNDVDICVGGNALLTAVITGGSGGGTSIWQSSPDSIAWTAISGATSPTYSPPTGSPGSMYYRYYTVEPGNSNCPSPVISNAALVVVNPDPTVNVSVSNSTICVGGTTTLTANIAGGSPSQIIQWQSAASSGGPWTDISGENDTTFVFLGVTASTYLF